MTSCENLSERMPAVAAGGQWTAAEASHLAGCRDCAEECRIVEAGRRLGGSLALDPDRIAARVRTRLGSEPVVAPVPIRRFRPVRWAVAGLAAAALLVLAIRTVEDDPAVGVAVTDQPGVVLTELEDLSSSELESMLGDLAPGEVPSPAMAISGLNDLSPEELEGVLRDWES